MSVWELDRVFPIPREAKGDGIPLTHPPTMIALGRGLVMGLSGGPLAHADLVLTRFSPVNIYWKPMGFLSLKPVLEPVLSDLDWDVTLKLGIEPVGARQMPINGDAILV